MKRVTLLCMVALFVGCYVEREQPPVVYSGSQPAYADPSQGGYAPPAAQGNVTELQAYQAIHATNTRTGSQRSDIRMQTTSWEPVPTVLDSTTSGPFVVTQPVRVMLAGDASGTQNFQIDNFVLVEALDMNGQLLSSGLVGQTETAVLNQRAIPVFGSPSYGPAATDITGALPPRGTPFYLRVTALDYGGGVFVSDVWIVPSGSGAVVQTQPVHTPPPVVQPSTPSAPELSTLRIVNARNGRTSTTRPDIRIQTTSWEPVPTVIDGLTADVARLSASRRIVLAGNADGSGGWRIDNFVLLEVLGSSNEVIAVGLVGSTEPVVLNGQTVQHLAPDAYEFGGPVDVSAIFPVGRPFRVRATAFDYGGASFASDIWLVVR